MTAATPLQPRHPVAATVARVKQLLAEVADTALWSMNAEETTQTLTELAEASAGLAELEARVARHADTAGVAERAGATSMAAWWAHTMRITRPDAHRRMRLAAALDRYPVLRAGLAAGEVNVEQA